MVIVNELVKEFNPKKKEKVIAVKGISFEAKEGEIFGLIGDNGAGKTTTLRVLSTLISPTSGTVTVGGKDVVADSTAVRASLGFLSGTTGLYARLNPRDLLRYFGGLYGLVEPDLTKRINYLIDRFQIGDFADRQCDRLSTGQKQRVGLARAIIHSPKILFLDEPTAGLDVQASQGVLEFIEGARNQGHTIIFCTHIMTEVERLCDRVVILHEGRIVGSGTVDEIKAQAGEESMEKAFLKIVDYKPEAVIF